MQKIVLASSNKGKAKEIVAMMPGYEIICYTDLIEPLVIHEDGSTFAENAIIKATTIAGKLPNMFILADDSGLSVPALNNEPGIFSARYAGENATDLQNIQKLCDSLKLANIARTKAFYTAAMTLVANNQLFTAHGFCYGEVINAAQGSSGFGYDPIFIPKGYDTTFGCLDDSVKLTMSHRTQALALIKLFLQMYNK